MDRQSPNELNTLFTSVGRRVELVRAFRDAYRSLGLSGRLLGTDIDPLAPAMAYVDRAFMVPHVNSPEYVPALASICQRESVGLIIPLIDPDVSVLSKAHRDLEATGARLAVLGSDAAVTVTDKLLTHRFFRSLGLATPDTWLCSDLPDRGWAFPLFIKPRAGSAGKHTYRIDSAEELTFFSRYVRDAVIQEYVDGDEVTTDVLTDLHGAPLAVVSRRRIESRSGEVSKGVTVYDTAITEACLSIARELPAVGPITVQCIVRAGVPYFTEINGRFGGGCPLGIAAGADYPRWLLARVVGIPLDIPPIGSYQQGLYLTRFDNSLFLTELDVAQIQGHSV